jgi:hypothetical protein
LSSIACPPFMPDDFGVAGVNFVFGSRPRFSCAGHGRFAARSNCAATPEDAIFEGCRR